MKQYLLSVIEPTGGGTPPNIDEIMRDVGVVDQEMRSAGVWVFADGLHEPSSATTLRPEDGEVLATDGPFAEGKEHLGGFTIIKAADLDAALEWGRKLAVATTLPVEVRPFRGEA
jgi:hypothetical protein